MSPSTGLRAGFVNRASACAACARLPVMNVQPARRVESDMSDLRIAVVFGWYFYYGMTTQGRAYR